MPATRARRERYRKSLLDMARDETQKLAGTLGRFRPPQGG